MLLFSREIGAKKIFYRSIIVCIFQKGLICLQLLSIKKINDLIKIIKKLLNFYSANSTFNLESYVFSVYAIFYLML